MVAFVAGLPFGAVGVAVSYSACTLIVLLPLIFFVAGRRGPVTTRDLWFVFGRQLPVWGVAYFSTAVVRSSLRHLGPGMQVLLSVPAGVGIGSLFLIIYRPSRVTVMALVHSARRWTLRGTPAPR